MAAIKLLHMVGGGVAGVPAAMSDQRIRYELADVARIEAIIDRCGVETGWGPWACLEPVGHREHVCHRHDKPATRLCAWNECRAPICDRPGCHIHHR